MKRGFREIGFERQPDPSPPDRIPAQTPSLRIYLALVLVAIMLILVSFLVDGPDWPGLLLNLSTELVGAIIILIIVDRQIRRSEIHAVTRYVEDTSIRFAALFSRELSTTLTYASVLNTQIKEVIPGYYVRRPYLEDLLEQHPEGFVLLGKTGIGKSTLIQVIAMRETEKLLRKPRKYRIPVLIPMRLWNGDRLEDFAWSEMSKYAPITEKTFNHWLKHGRLVLFFDAVDESNHPIKALNEIADLKKKYPQTSVVLSSRVYPPENSESEKIEGLGLPLESVEEFTDSETEALYGAYEHLGIKKPKKDKR